MSKKFKAQKDSQKLLSESQFEEIFMEYLYLMDEFDAYTRNHLSRMKLIRYHVDQGIDEHPELVKRLYRVYEDQKVAKHRKKA